MDRRSFQNSFNDKNSPEQCIHTRNVFSLIDLYPSEASYHKIKSHMKDCKVCDGAFRKFELESLEVRIHIPKPQIDSDTKGVFESEVHELFKTFDLNEKELLRKKIKTKIKKIDMFGADFMNNLASKNMLKTYAFALVLFVVLRRFFN